MVALVHHVGEARVVDRERPGRGVVKGPCREYHLHQERCDNMFCDVNYIEVRRASQGKTRESRSFASCTQIRFCDFQVCAT